MDFKAITARNGTESGLELLGEFNPVDWIRLENEFWRIGKRYKTVTGSVNRDGQTGWKGALLIRLPFWDEAILLRPEATIYRDLNALNPRNPDEWNSLYSIGANVRLPWRAHFLANAGYEDQSGSPLPFLAQRYDATLSREFPFRENPWLQDLLFGKELIRSFTPFFGIRYADFEKSNNIPGFDATLEMFRVGARLNFPKGVWGEVSWSQGQLQESNPGTGPQTIQPKELVVETGANHRFRSPPVSVDVSFRYVDVEDTFRKTHQPFADRNRLSGTLRLAWRMAEDRELFGTVSATRQRPETIRENTLLDLFAQIGFRTAWDTGWAFTRRGRIAGSFFRDLNFNGKQEATEPGIAGVRISVVDGPSAVTNPDGRFVLRSVREGPRTVKVEPAQVPKGYFFTTPNTVELLVLPGQEAGVFFGISTQVEFRGRVYNDLNENRAFDEETDDPLQGVIFALETGQSSLTDATGFYRIGKVSPGLHTLSVVITSIPDGYQSLVPIRKEVTTKEGDVVTFDLSLKALRSLSGSVFLDADGSGARDSEETGAQGVRVRIGPREAITDEKGNYQLEDLASGVIQVDLDPETIPPRVRLRFPKSVLLDIPRDPFLHRLDFALVPVDWKSPEETLPLGEDQPTALTSETAPKPEQGRAQIFKSRIRAILQELAPRSASIQIVDARPTEQFPELRVLSELHPGIWIDRGETPGESAALVRKLTDRSAYHVHYYGISDRARRFLEIAEAARIEVELREAIRYQVLLREILVNLSGRTEEDVASRVDFVRLDVWLAQIVEEEK